MSNIEDDSNGWGEYRREVMGSLKAVRDDIRRLEEQQVKTREEVAGLKAKAGLAGGLMGLVGSAVLSMAVYLWEKAQGK